MTRSPIHADWRQVLLAISLSASMACGREAQAPRTDTSSVPSGTAPAIPDPTRAIAGTGTAAHEQYASQGIQCQACHPCGAKPTGHDAAWMDQASPSFHALSANAGIASCQACHGAQLDGVGGTTGVSCAQCHGASWKTNCLMCHGGTDNQTGAPPKAIWGHASDAVRVGTHTSHVGATHALAPAVACDVCHVKPADVLSPGHLDAQAATVTFSGLASQFAGTLPAWSRVAATCSNTYCHGGTLAGGTKKAPVWTTSDGSQRTCDACHGAPPPNSSHTRSDLDCAACHPAGYSLMAGSVVQASHVDGKLDVSVTCTSCHGSSASSAPPAGTRGETATSARAVGAHQRHLVTNTVGKAVACNECHVVPTVALHSNGVVDVAWGARATTGGAMPAWNGVTCAGTYCHGATLGGGTNRTPAWTTVDGTQDACGTCHGVPPPPPHVARNDCGTCHAGYTATTVNLATHVDGRLDVDALTCSTCHGTASRASIAGADTNQAAAPPVDSRGNTATATSTVGVHVQHVNQATYRSAPIACSECHFDAVPISMSHNDGTVQFAFGTLARTSSWGGVTPAPAWNGSTCAGTYCHGNFKNGTAATVTWMQAGGVTCGSCHGNPPGGGHVQSGNCGSCHSGYTSASVNKVLHMNGALDVVAMTCTSCHGSAGMSATAASPLKAAPPVDTLGAATGLRVGTHQSHLVGKTYSSGTACQNCHPTVGAYTTTHSNGTSNVAFTNGTSTSFNVGSFTSRNGTTPASCASTWCHAVKNGSRSSGGTLPAPSWTASITACTACHAVPPSTGRHGMSEHRVACGSCHPGYAATSSANSTTVNKLLHVNGTFDVGGSGTRINSWSPSTHSCQPSCHGRETW